MSHSHEPVLDALGQPISAVTHTHDGHTHTHAG